MSGAFVGGVGLIAPGLPSWPEARAILTGAARYTNTSLAPVQSQLLPPNERRRAPLGVRLALRAAEEATMAASLRPAELASVFATSDADIEIIHRIAMALAEPARSVSPTDFHNSVHNAACGYWSIGTGARGPATAVSAYDFSLAAGLREALALLAIDDTDVLLVLYDVPPPAPLYAKRPVAHPAAIALALARARTERSLARISLCEASTELTLDDPGLEALRLTNPATRALPLLQRLATRSPGIVGIRAYGDRCLGICVEAP